jgi:hypothetical protein
MDARLDSEARYLLRRLLLSCPEELTSAHRWVLEGERWKELVFALLTRISTSISESSVRVVTDHLAALGLLSVGELASLKRALGSNSEAPLARRIKELLEDGGFTSEEAQRGVVTVCEAAEGLQTRYSGKVQVYLRSYAERMLDDVKSVFHFDAMDGQSVRAAFTYWLQNVLSMPVSLQDDAIRTFGAAHGLTPEHLSAAADELDVNVALLDDLVRHFHASEWQGPRNDVGAAPIESQSSKPAKRRKSRRPRERA